jgi:hypothetical protein
MAAPPETEGFLERRYGGINSMKPLKSEVDLVVDAIKRLLPQGPPQHTGSVSWGKPAIDVMDVILSLNRNYSTFVVPRLQTFQVRHPDVHSIADLLALIATHNTPLDFMRHELDYNDAARAQTLVEVCRFLVHVQAACPGKTEGDRLLYWALAAKPEDYAAVGIHGFGLAGFQYLRIFFGADTAKPDRHLCRFVAEAVGHPVADVVVVLALLEAAAKILGWSLAAIEYAIWEDRAQGGIAA